MSIFCHPSTCRVLQLSTLLKTQEDTPYKDDGQPAHDLSESLLQTKPRYVTDHLRPLNTSNRPLVFLVRVAILRRGHRTQPPVWARSELPLDCYIGAKSQDYATSTCLTHQAHDQNPSPLRVGAEVQSDVAGRREHHD
ncbi:hypothetical protein HRR83_006130 [Exophiala dermatitidis]|uniref:Uncharacterized protein n=1 Tax=Exophiala dermatitidis TaxID=5970 RepID=A0AAN6ISK1_EXODE|nr:hypothetical protein HRR74_005527 [Exophiala dermatitidis]KAJ4517553.1 hypothetical protein HRR73_004605 [Exophiala dermatitidis]KAJ4548686.1 hypothetical protein HRR76_001275 [Exophiala dermatitidis]KAJ4552594.1 hypothetical protein HRR77_002595 [Exophiala dermatitidis]KAJ4568549.1 hypothetical protein HRR79_004761 [Exophiala dermatitidis]